jgi:hypothetical protein
VQALCGFEFRNGRQATVPEFMAFNHSYIDRLRRAGVRDVEIDVRSVGAELSIDS